MVKTLLLGLGGTGSRIVDKTAGEILRKGFSFNTDSANFFGCVLDTNDNDAPKIKHGVPVFGTALLPYVKDYQKKYPKLNDWFDAALQLNGAEMKAGAGQLRFKSRLAFMDYTQWGGNDFVRFLGNIQDSCIEGENLRVILVSSIAGGTGSGMFMQAAMYVKKMLNNMAVEVKGILVLPDIFFEANSNMNRELEKERIQANAYAALRELNAVEMLNIGGDGYAKPIVIDDLFDSTKLHSKAGELKDPNPKVFDKVFFVGSSAGAGNRADDLSQYEALIANIVFMQTFPPMANEQHSVEDNWYAHLSSSDDVLFGANNATSICYPTDDMVRYCATKSALDSISGFWGKIDYEIESRVLEEKRRIEEGHWIPPEDRIRPAQEFIKIFDDKRRDPEFGGDPDFYALNNEIKIRIPNPDLDEDEEKDRATIFAMSVRARINSAVKSDVDITAFRKELNDSNMEGDQCNNCDVLLDRVKKDNRRIKKMVAEAHKIAYRIAHTVYDEICPLYVDSLGSASPTSFYRLFTVTEGSQTRFVHPLSARYLMYQLENSLDSTPYDVSVYQNIKEMAEQTAKFDNTLTAKTESTAEEYLKSRRFLQLFGFYEEFKEKYKTYQNSLLTTFDESIQKDAFAILSELFTKNIKCMLDNVDLFFRNIVETMHELQGELRAISHMHDRSRSDYSHQFVCAAPEAKDLIYSATVEKCPKLAENRNAANKPIITALYGMMCAAARPKYLPNREYLSLDINSLFKNDLVSTAEKTLRENQKNLTSCLFLDISDAVYFEVMAQNPGLSNAAKLDGLYCERMEHYLGLARSHAAPLLNYVGDAPESGTYWGYDAAIADKHNKRSVGLTATSFAALTGGTKSDSGDTESDRGENTANALTGYAKDEILCYRSIYGIKAESIKGFSEDREQPGDCYAAYRRITDRMRKNAFAIGHTHTPHLDRSWHKILPMLSSAARDEEAMRLPYDFWLYMTNPKFSPSLPSDKKAMTVFDGFKKTLFLTDDEGLHVDRTNIKKIFTLLKSSELFDAIGDLLEDDFNADLKQKQSGGATISDYVRTVFISNAQTSNKNDEWRNAYNILVNYAKCCKNHLEGADAEEFESLIDGLVRVLCDVVRVNYADENKMIATVAERILIMADSAEGIRLGKKETGEATPENTSPAAVGEPVETEPVAEIQVTPRNSFEINEKQRYKKTVFDALYNYFQKYYQYSDACRKFIIE